MRTIAFPLIIAILTLAIAVNGYLDPNISWDLLPYTACSLEFDESDHSVIHEQTYELIEKNTTGSEFDELAHREGYRAMMFEESDYFHQQLGFYRIKPMYVMLMYVMMKLGLGAPSAGVLISVLSCIGICIVTALWIGRYFRGFVGVGLWMLVIIVANVPTYSGFSSPDSLGAFLCLFAVYLMLERSSVILSAVLLMLAIIARPDSITLAVPLLLYTAFTNVEELRIGWTKAIVLCSASLALYIGIGWIAGGYGWWTLFWHTFVGKIYAPEMFNEPISFTTYFSVFVHNIPELTSYRFPFIILLALSTFLLTGIKFTIENRYVHVVAAIVVIFAGRYILFPAIYERFLIAHYLTIMLSFVAVLHSVIYSKRKIQRGVSLVAATSQAVE